MFEIQLRIYKNSNFLWGILVDSDNQHLYRFASIDDAENCIIKLKNEFIDSDFRIVEVE